MKLTPLAKQLKHFKSHQRLQGVPLQPLSNPEVVSTWVNEVFEKTRAEDDGPEDYDPLPQRVFKTNTKQGRTVGAAYRRDGLDCQLERSEIHYRERRLLRVHETALALEVFWSWSHPNYPQLLECYRVDHRDPKGNFYQKLELEPEPWV